MNEPTTPSTSASPGLPVHKPKSRARLVARAVVDVCGKPALYAVPAVVGSIIGGIYFPPPAVIAAAFGAIAGFTATIASGLLLSIWADAKEAVLKRIQELENKHD